MVHVALTPEALSRTMIHSCNEGQTSCTVPMNQHTHPRHLCGIKPLIQCLRMRVKHTWVLRRTCFLRCRCTAAQRSRPRLLRGLLRRKAILQAGHDAINLCIQLLALLRVEQRCILLLHFGNLLMPTEEQDGMQPAIDGDTLRSGSLEQNSVIYKAPLFKGLSKFFHTSSSDVLANFASPYALSICGGKVPNTFNHGRFCPDSAFPLDVPGAIPWFFSDPKSSAMAARSIRLGNVQYTEQRLEPAYT